MASAGSSGRPSSGPRSFDFGSDDVLCSYDDFTNQDSFAGKRPDPPAKDYHESRSRPLVNVYGQQDEYPKEELISAVEKCMKKYVDNLLQHLEGISGRLSQLEVYCYKLERSVGEFRADMIRDHKEADTKLESVDKHLQEVHRSVQILRDKQELNETQKELSKLQFASKDSATPPQPKKIEEVNAPSSDNAPEIPNQQLALALPHQISTAPPPPPSVPSQNQLPLQQSVNMQQEHYMLNQMPPYYPQRSQPLQPEQYYVPSKPQMQDYPVQAPPPTPQQQVNQIQAQLPFPPYQQQWPQSAPQPITQQGAASTQQPIAQTQLVRPRTPPTYPYQPQQAPNPGSYSYTNVSQSGGNRSEAASFGYGSSGTAVNMQSQPQHHNKLPGGYLTTPPHQPQPNIQGYNTAYGMEGGRAQNYQPGSYQGPNNVAGPPVNMSGYHSHGSQQLRSHPHADMIEKAASMGYSRDQVASVINRMEESGQQVDFNALLDRLNSY